MVYRSGQVRFITRPKSRTRRAKRKKNVRELTARRCPNMNRQPSVWATVGRATNCSSHGRLPVHKTPGLRDAFARVRGPTPGLAVNAFFCVLVRLSVPGHGHPGPRPRPRPRFVRGRGRGVRPRFGRGRGRSPVPVPDLLNLKSGTQAVVLEYPKGVEGLALGLSHNSP